MGFRKLRYPAEDRTMQGPSHIRAVYETSACKAPHHFCQWGLDGGDGQKLLDCFGRAGLSVPSATYLISRAYEV